MMLNACGEGSKHYFAILVLVYRGLHNVCNRNVKSEKATTVNFKLVVQGFWKWVVSIVCISQPLYTLQPEVLGFVWCTLSHCLFPKAMDNQQVHGV